MCQYSLKHCITSPLSLILSLTTPHALNGVCSHYAYKSSRLSNCEIICLMLCLTLSTAIKSNQSTKQVHVFTKTFFRINKTKDFLQI